MKFIRNLALSCALHGSLVHAAEHKFDFTAEKALPGFTKISPDTLYGTGQNFGYLPGQALASGQPVNFAVDVDEGNYQVTLRFGHAQHATCTTVKTESRRLVIENLTTTPGNQETRTFTVNVRKPAIRGGGGITKLNARETGPPLSPGWDDRLSFEFNGKNPGVVSMEIKPVKDAITIFLAGDSTVTDQVYEPYAGWGQMLPRFMGSQVAVSNHAESGLALRSFESQKRLAKILSMMKRGDYLFIQFGHNDQKDRREGAGPFTTYKQALEKFVRAVDDQGGIPVLVTPMERRRFDRDGKPEATLADYAKAVRQVGKEQKVSVIDLHAMSIKLYAALGPDASTKAFVFYPAGTVPGMPQALKDNTHHNNFGGYELARCVVEGIRENVPKLAKHLAPDAGHFNPENPDSPEKFAVPMSPLQATAPPAGS